MRRSKPKSIFGRASAPFYMLATSPKKYDRNEFSAHIVAGLQACRLDPFAGSEYKNKLFSS
jgi:hypothetical protein